MSNQQVPGVIPSRESLPEKPDSGQPEIAKDQAPEATPDSASLPREIQAESAAESIAVKKNEIKSQPAQESASAASVPVPPVSHPTSYVNAADLKKLESQPRAEQVKCLTEIVYQHGLDRAIAAVRHLNDPYLLDLLHDTLVDELFQKLKGPRLKK